MRERDVVSTELSKQFVSYQIAMLLKELGFNEHCFAFFNEKKELFLQDKPNAFWTKNDSIGWMHIPFKKGKSNLCSAPLWQQALDWIAENSNLLINVRVDYSYSRESKYYFYTIYSIGGNSGQSTSSLESMYVARELAIETALNIMKNGKETEN